MTTFVPGENGVGNSERPLCVAIVGSGPAGFYAAEWLFREKGLNLRIDMFERLPAPYGLVRFGVAPDHQKIKRAAAAFEKTAAHEGFRFFGNVTIGHHLSAEELLQHYDQVLYTIGSASDRRLGIPGEELAGSEAATAFVGWYNGHPDFRDLHVDLQTERVVVVGVGNVAMDVARVLVRDVNELAQTDITDYALDALRASKVREVVLLGRRGVAQAAFDQGELEDIVGLSGVSVSVDPGAPLDTEHLDELDHATRKNVTYVSSLVHTPPADGTRRVHVRFLVSPVELVGKDGKVSAVKLERNRLERRPDGTVSARGTGEYEELPTGLVLRSIGYRGIALVGLPFDEVSSTVPNVEGRVLQQRGGPVLPKVYVAGWIKRGPTGLIGTNRDDAHQTVMHMLSDVQALEPSPARDLAAVPRLLEERGAHVVTFDDWHKLDALEIATGQKLGKVRQKFHTVEAMLHALGRALAPR